MKYGKKFRALAAAVALASIALPAVAAERPSEGKVAVVNGSVISRDIFNYELTRARRSVEGQGKPLAGSQLSEIKEKVLERLIRRELLYQQSKNMGIEIDEGNVNEQLMRLKSRFAGEVEFRNELGKMNLSEATMKSQIEQGMAIQKVIDKRFGEKIAVSEKEVKAFYDSHPDSFRRPERVRASHILIRIDPQRGEPQKARAYEKTEEIRRKIQEGQDFEVLAREFSECPSSSEGGDLGYFSRGQMVKPFEEAAFALNPGKLSDIIETGFGYHLIKVTDKIPETAIFYEDVEENIRKSLQRQKARQQIGLYVDELRKNADVEIFLTEDK
jgi:peptidyl-prolyl cis-trans isomerase C